MKNKCNAYCFEHKCLLFLSITEFLKLISEFVILFYFSLVDFYNRIKSLAIELILMNVYRLIGAIRHLKKGVLELLVFFCNSVGPNTIIFLYANTTTKTKEGALILT